MNTQIKSHSLSARGQSRRGISKLGSQSGGFTLVEILVVLAIIAILAALLFPAFKGAQENGKQTNCAANLQQIFTATKLYYDDEKKYPANLAVLLPATEELDNSGAAAPTPSGTPSGTPAPASGGTLTNTKGTGYLKSASSIVCPDDDTNSTGVLRSSYSNVATTQPALPVTPATVDAATMDPGRFVWNYWGYNNEGFAYDKQNDTATATGYFGVPGDGLSLAGDSANRYVRDSNKKFDAATNPIDVQKLPRLANRYAPEDTIITHCVFHRMPTSNLVKSTEIYSDTANSGGAKDIVLRLSGKAEVIDVTTWKGEKWNKQLR